MGGGYLLIILILLVVTNGITYGVSQYTSDSVSYTRNGETKSVKEALDDLIVKVDKKSGNFNITLAQRTIGIDYTESVSTYKSIADNVLGKMITAMGTDVSTTELSTLKSSTLTWKSENTGIASVTNNTTVKGVATGTTKIIGTASTGQQVIVPVNVIKGVYLADKVSSGQYVAYDAGQWDAAKASPTAQEKFGGNGIGNKAVSVKCGGFTPTSSGWKVLKVVNKQVYLVHAGQPECYYLSTGYAGASKNLLDERARTYMDVKYAESAHAMTKEEVDAIAESDNLRATRARYSLATASDNTNLYYVGESGAIGLTYSAIHGFRPVVVLKSTVLTTGTGTDKAGNSGAWLLA